MSDEVKRHRGHFKGWALNVGTHLDLYDVDMVRWEDYQACNAEREKAEAERDAANAIAAGERQLTDAWQRRHDTLATENEALKATVERVRAWRENLRQSFGIASMVEFDAATITGLDAALAPPAEAASHEPSPTWNGVERRVADEKFYTCADILAKPIYARGPERALHACTRKVK